MTEDTRELQRFCDRDQGAIVLRGSSGLPRGPGVILPGRRPVRTPESSMGLDPSLSIELGLGWASDIPRENGGKFSIFTQMNPFRDAYGFFLYIF